MRKIIFSVILILFTVSCATFMAGPYPDDPNLNLLYGVYCASLITNPPQTRYYYPTLSTELALDLAWLDQIPPKSYYRSPYFYCPPSVWAAWTPLQRSLWIESALKYEFRDYKYKLRSINDMEMWKLKREVQRLIDDLERAKED